MECLDSMLLVEQLSQLSSLFADHTAAIDGVCNSGSAVECSQTQKTEVLVNVFSVPRSLLPICVGIVLD
jgi:hypothetical protein